ncbi:MAG: hypothetical protein OXG15_14015 [Gammaproteobacteria bacterium]|nr:hypothetical protein [Gammaproteobacteria bacterium]
MPENLETTDTTPCAEVSAALNEPMIGSAPQVGLWILLEVRDVWEAKNLEANSLPDVANAWLEDAMDRGEAEGLMPRAQFIRHRRRPSDPLTVMTFRDGELRRQEISDYSELTAIDPLNCQMPKCEEILYFVCTHARRDVCCSREGLPTWQRLDTLSSGRAWQTTHLGGHRFAPNVLTLPTARSYGRVRVDEVDVFFADIESGAVPARFLRGNSALPPDAQACEPTILANGGHFVGLSDTDVKFETESGIHTTPIPAKLDLEILAGCREREWKTVEVYEATA